MAGHSDGTKNKVHLMGDGGHPATAEGLCHPLHSYLAMIVSMRGRNQCRKTASDRGTCRPNDASMATGEEEHVVPTSCNDAEHTADNPEHEKSRMNLRKHQNIGTWNVQGMTAGKLKIITTRMDEQHIGVLGISETW